MRKASEKKIIGWAAAPEELRQIAVLKKLLRRRSNADLLRFLIQQEADKTDLTDWTDKNGGKR